MISKSIVLFIYIHVGNYYLQNNCVYYSLLMKIIKIKLCILGGSLSRDVLITGYLLWHIAQKVPGNIL